MIEQRPGLLDLAYQGACEAVLRWVAQFPVERIATPQTSLEEVLTRVLQGGRARGRARAWRCGEKAT